MKHVHCEGCGEKLEARFVFSHYGRSTGKPLYSKHWICPKRHWYNFFLHDFILVKGGSFGTAMLYFTEDEVKSEMVAT